MKRITTFIRLLVCLIFMAATTQHALAAIDITATQPANGTGTTADPYQIGTPGELYWFAAQVNNGQNTISAKLTADIVVNENVLKAGTLTLNGTPANVWTPIGTNSNTFKGTFDGNVHTISGLYFNNRTNKSYPDGGNNIGFIGYAEGAVIKNVVVKDSYIYGYYYVAGICGYANGSTQITNCGYEGYVGGSYEGGIAYNYSATVENCYSVSNKPLSNKATTNCYHDNSKYTRSTTYSTGKPSEAFASGEVAFLLGDAWGQKIGTDATPRLGGDKVYATALCPHTNSYSNTPSDYIPITDGPEHYDSDGFCEICGAGLPATLVNGYYEIDNVGKLYWFANQVNNGQNAISAKLTADIVVNENVLKAGTFDLNGTPSKEWTPIGTSSNNFKGTFDGNGHTISGLYFNNRTYLCYPDGGIYIGLIGVAYGAVIKNVVVNDSYINGYEDVAGICGYAAGSTQITNCGYVGCVNGFAYGITYNYSATVENCYSVSNKPLAYNATTNCYHDNNKYTGSTTYSTGKPSEAFASGEVAWLLGDAWGQKIGTDATLRLGGDKVYATALCPHTNSYSNTPSDYIPITDGPDHYDSDGYCEVCGAGQPATLVNGYYEIDDAGKLYWFANQVNNGQNTISAKLTADIVVNENVLKAGTFDLNGTPSKEWTPIGTSSNNFKGTFDGNGHTISGLYFNNTTNSNYPVGGNYIGLIGYVNGATIKNVVVKDSYLNGYSYVAGICGGAYGSTKITNCGYVGCVNGFAYGIAYNYSATVENCYSVSNQRLAYSRTTNCYHDNNKYTSSTTASTGKSSIVFANGEVAFLLGDAWGQKIGTDATPRLGGDKVYKNTYSGECHGEGYSNVDEHGVVTERNHNCNEEGVCTQCGLHLISTADQLYAFAAKVNAGQTTISAKLTADIVVNENVLNPVTFDLNGTPSRSWTPIGTESKTFQGTFDGNGHTISGLYFYNTSYSSYPAGGKYIGLIGRAYGATIKNVVVKDSYIYGGGTVSGICGEAYGSTQITNCGYEGYVRASYDVYGIAYNNEATVENCYSVSNMPLSNKATTNCYHDNNKYTWSTTYSTGKPSIAFASGEVAFLLGEGWGQKIGTDALPIPGSDKVYKNTYSGECPGEGYSNVDEHGVVTERNHNCNAEGLCIHCGFYFISTADQLYAFAAKVNAGQTTISAKLTADIVVNENVLNSGTFDLNGTPSRSWTPIGTAGNTFSGTFDGNGHTISGLYFNNTTNGYYPAGGQYIGLIGYAYGATIKNVVVKDSYINGRYYVAGICGVAYTTQITNCGYEGYVGYNYRNGYGIANNESAIVENCYSVSNQPLAYKATTNCYHDNNKFTGSTANSTGKLSEAFANGEVAFLLGDAWGQKIGTDATPKLGGAVIYSITTTIATGGHGTFICPSYANEGETITVASTPATGYKLDEITAADASGNAIAVTNGKFTMPASAVNVNVVFSPTGYVENGTVYGDWVVTSDYTIAAGETLVIPAGTTVTTYGGAVIINNGTLKVEDEISGVTLAGDGVFNYTTLDKYDVTFGTATYNGSPITIGNGLDVTYATKTFCGKTFTFDAESCTITYTNNVNASVGTRYAVVTWNFSGNTATKEFAILKRELNLTGFIANNKNYDGTTQATGSFSDDRIAGDELEFNYKCAFDDENVGTGKNVSFYRIEIDGGADADNYELVTTEGSASANINKAPLTIKANDFTINVGDEMPTFTVEYDGFVAAQNVEVLSTLPTVGVDITETSVDGTYDINVSGAEADNYEISYTKGTLTIKPDTATAIDEVASADVKIYARGNIIVVENADSPIEVYDITGSCLERRGDILDRMEIPVSNAGIYVVRTDNTAKKIIVK